MPDLTIEYRFICLLYHDWVTTPKQLRGEKPACSWNQDIDGQEPDENGNCPECGGRVAVYRVGV